MYEQRVLGDSTTVSQTEVVQEITTSLKYTEKRNNVILIDLPFLRNWLDRTATDRKSRLLQGNYYFFLYQKNVNLTNYYN